MDAKSIFLTAQTTKVYGWAELNLKAGPMIVEIPPEVLGLVDDAYFRWVGDIGFSGQDKGAGGKYLFVHSDYKGEIPEGYFVLKSPSYRNLLVFRAFVKGDDFAQTAKNVKAKYRMYPLSEVENPPEQIFVNLSGKKMNTNHPTNFHFYEDLNAVIQYEPANSFNPEFTGLLASIGIKKRSTFCTRCQNEKNSE